MWHKGALMVVLALLAGCEGAPMGESADAASLERKRGLANELLALAAAANVTAVAPPAAPALITLGQMLMHDNLLSGNRDVSCATCHLEGVGTADALALSIGTGGIGLGADRQLGVGRGYVPRSAPPLHNLHTTDVLFADGSLSLAP